MQCIIIETSPERIAAKPVTNEDGTPAIYATMSEARAELKGNGYSYNRSNDRYYIRGTEYRAYIVREDSEEYAPIIEQAMQDAAPEYIETEAIQTVAGHTIYRSIDPVTSWTVFTVAGRDFWELAEARHFAQCNPETAEANARELESAARHAARRAAAAVDKCKRCAEQAAAAETPEAAAFAARKAEHYARRAAKNAAEAGTEAAAEYATTAAAFAAIAHSCANAATDPEPEEPTSTSTPEEEPEEPAPVYQRYELEAFCEEPDAYDLEAIEQEATTTDRAGRRVWRAGIDLAAIAERHELEEATA